MFQMVVRYATSFKKNQINVITTDEIKTYCIGYPKNTLRPTPLTGPSAFHQLTPLLQLHIEPHYRHPTLLDHKLQ